MYILKGIYIVLAERQMSSGRVGVLVSQWPDAVDSQSPGGRRSPQRAATASLDFPIADICNRLVLADKSLTRPPDRLGEASSTLDPRRLTAARSIPVPG